MVVVQCRTGFPCAENKQMNKLALRSLDWETYINIDGSDLHDDEEIVGAGHGIFFGDTRPDDNEWFFNVVAEGMHEKCLIMSCNCGQADCMSLWGTIVVEPDKVHWR